MRKILFNDGWQISEPDFLTDAAGFPEKCAYQMDALVPGDVHSTLLRHGKIEDPYFGMGAEKCRWVEEKTWWYHKSFSYQPQDFPETCLRLVFYGLDTTARIFLNRKLLGKHENMFTPAIFDISGQCIAGENSIEVCFSPAIAEAEERLAAYPMADNLWYSYNRGRAWVRKAQYATRWDWGPRIVTAGIWKNVELEAFSAAKIKSVFLHTKQIQNGVAELAADVGVEYFSAGTPLQMDIVISDEHQSVHISIALNQSATTVHIRVEKPVLWWTNGLGEAHLYQVVATLSQSGEQLDQYQTEFGIRTLRVVQQSERGEPRFLFELNGEPVFAKGANWIPASSMPGTLGEEVYTSWIALACRANMNMLRVWGGGYYEQEWFYRACDRNGILVWQDFMFACSSYPDFETDFMENIRKEVEYAVVTLRNHACLALWCGNNEIQWIHNQKLWELKDKNLYGTKIFHELIPSVLSQLDSTRLYWPSSPFGGNDPNSDEEGDKHNWQVWAGQVYPQEQGKPSLQDNTPSGVSFKNFASDKGLFLSEFGMHAAPVLETLRECLPPEQLNLGSFQLRYRNRDKRPDRGVMLMEDYTGQPCNLEEYIEYSMMCQAEGLRFGIEHYRRRFPACGGALLWQLNDCWPALGWSIVDYHQRPKAGYYAVAKAFSQVILSFCDKGNDEISLWGINDRQVPYKSTVEIGVVDFLGNREYQASISIEIPANAAVELKRLSKNRMNINYTNFEVLYARFTAEKDICALHYCKDFKDLNLPECTLHVQERRLGERQAKIEVSTDVIAKFVRLTCPDGVTLSDNYFDILPDESKIVTAFWEEGVPFYCTANAINSK